jgi:hypothetical protein
VSSSSLNVLKPIKMDERDGPPPEELVLTPVSASAAINSIPPLDLLLDAQPKEGYNHIASDDNQQTKVQTSF